MAKKGEPLRVLPGSIERIGSALFIVRRALIRRSRDGMNAQREIAFFYRSNAQSMGA